MVAFFSFLFHYGFVRHGMGMAGDGECLIFLFFFPFFLFIFLHLLLLLLLPRFPLFTPSHDKGVYLLASHGISLYIIIVIINIIPFGACVWVFYFYFYFLQRLGALSFLTLTYSNSSLPLPPFSLLSFFFLRYSTLFNIFFFFSMIQYGMGSS
ncbi:hypothetical protein L873DRAFT_489698 [Choiromyces venosus 120613-1]|uniref:Uncharacterized protein n=1 Tax=Choiromyces venosus 120613-1 TaxID=1336337 RepID=A0A3N4JVA7_9PEZI|nr:hypothetical protein L873DRAFT_489698 [Choiromyces venosus 120613-1]